MDIFTQYGIMASVGEAGFPMYELLYDSDVSATLPATQLDITGLNITKDDEVRLVWTAVGNITALQLYVNDVNSDASYTVERLEAEGTSRPAARFNVPRIGEGIRSSGVTDIKLSNDGKVVWQSSAIRNIGSSASSMFLQHFNGVLTTQTFSSITKLSLKAAVNQIATGSRLQLYKLNQAWKSIQDYTVPSTTTSVTLNSFGTITKDDFVRVAISHTATASVDLKIYANADTTDTNYYHQYLYNDGTNVYAGRRNFPLIGYTPTGLTSIQNIHLKLSENDKLNVFTVGNRRNDGTIALDYSYTTSTSSFASGISSLTFQGHLANGIGAGTRIQIYKLQAQKVADITVASDTTQVDISDLNIKRNAEYLLVSDFAPNTQGTLEGSLYINDDLTNANYYVQRIYANNTTVGAVRYNEPNFEQFGTTHRGVAYVHLKLSEIGAFTFQSYSAGDVGGSSVLVDNWFVSSTKENITSITKLNIKTQGTNQIKTGTRFQLYKLYEPEPEPFTTYELLYDSDVSATLPATQIDITGLSIGKDDELRLVYTLKGDSGTSSLMRLYPNDLTTDSNYYVQVLDGYSSTIAAARINDATFTYARSDSVAQGFADIKISNNDRFVIQSQYAWRIGSGSTGAQDINNHNRNVVGTQTVSSMTKLSLVCNRTNGIATGSRIRLYKVNTGAA